jgi:hypothetical protein
MSITTTSSLCKKTFGSKSNATIQNNGAHLRKDFEILPCTYTEKIPLT